jgi:hypothetical protein
MDGLAAWAALDVRQRTAAIAAGLLVVSTLGPFSFVEAALLLVAAAVLGLLVSRGAGKSFELPLSDGTLLAAAGTWSAVLIATRVFDRPLGQNLLALSCAGLLTLAGLLQRGEHPAPAPVVPLPVEPPPPPAAVATPRPEALVPGVRWLNGAPPDEPTDPQPLAER